jgi:hypothetical protein
LLVLKGLREAALISKTVKFEEAVLTVLAFPPRNTLLANIKKGPTLSPWQDWRNSVLVRI